MVKTRMRNLAMERKLASGEARDVSKFDMDSHGDYILPRNWYRDGVDYCDAANETWIWSIGRHIDSGQVLASTTSKFYQNAAYVCLWLR